MSRSDQFIPPGSLGLLQWRIRAGNRLLAKNINENPTFLPIWFWKL